MKGYRYAWKGIARTRQHLAACRNNGAGWPQDLFTILKGYGITCGIEEAAAMAVGCKDAGLQVLVGFHYGDTWNSGLPNIDYLDG